MIKKLLEFLKTNLIYILMMAFVALAFKYSSHLYEANENATKLSKEKQLLSSSLLNVQSDKRDLELALESERQVNKKLTDSIEQSEKQLKALQDANKENEKIEKIKTDKLNEIVKESANENCINIDMPNDVISLFNDKTD